MSFQEWLIWACKHRGSEHDHLHKHLLPELKLKDGISLSVQASEFHMCDPEITSNDGSIYETVEVYTHGNPVDGLDMVEEVSPSTYGHIWIEEMENICNLHGGIEIYGKD